MSGAFLDSLPVGACLLVTGSLVLISIEGGYQAGRARHRRSGDEKESPVSAVAGSILALLAFILAFTFAIVTERFDARKALVREEANVIWTAHLRADFLPEPDRGQARELIRTYLELRLGAVQTGDPARVRETLSESQRIHDQLWEMAVVNARKDMNSDVAALYIESINELINVHALRVIVGMETRIPSGIWAVLSVLLVLGMASMGYQFGIAGSRRSLAIPVLAFSFSLVIVLIIALDRPQSSMLWVSQRPLEFVQARIMQNPEILTGTGEPR